MIVFADKDSDDEILKVKNLSYLILCIFEI